MIDLQKIVDVINEKIGNRKIDVAIILGSGLAGLTEKFENRVNIGYELLPNMPRSSVQGHKNQFVFGTLSGKNILAIQGRFHLYDGFTASESVLPIEILNKLGVSELIVTNASGGINEDFNVGDIMIITDHINFTGKNPLINNNYMGKEKFIPLNNAYSNERIDLITKVASDLKIDLKFGVYAQFIGPSYETRAECKMARIMGADAVGMSTALEVIDAAKNEMNVLGVSLISNKSADQLKQGETLNHMEVLKMGELAREKLEKLLINYIKLL